MKISNVHEGAIREDEKFYYHLAIEKDYRSLRSRRFRFFLGRFEKQEVYESAVKMRKPYIHITFAWEFDFTFRITK